MSTGIIYKATNLINGKCYIGKTIQKFEQRQYEHKKKANKSIYRGFCGALRKYGFENFSWEILCECDVMVLGIRETMKIIVEHSHYTESGYNLTWGNDGGPWQITEEQIKRRRERNITHPPMLGRHHTDDVKKKISDRMIGNKYNKKYSDGDMIKSVQLIKEGYKFSEASIIMNIPKTNIYRWYIKRERGH